MQSEVTSERPNAARDALLVTCSNYEDPGLRRLRPPAQHVEALGRVLADPAIGGFQVDAVTDQPREVVQGRIADFFANRWPDEVLLLYLSGHAIKDGDGSLYFATSETRLSSLDTTAVSAESVRRSMNRSRSRRVVLLLDCCFSSASSREVTDARADKAVRVREQFSGRGRVVVTASVATEYRFERGQPTGEAALPSLFTTTIIRGLETGEADRDADGYISVDELYEYVLEQLRTGASGQTPSKWSFGVEKAIIVARSPRPRELEPARLPEQLIQLLTERDPEARIGAVGDLQDLLGTGPPGVALAARRTLIDLREHDDSISVRAAAVAALEQVAPNGDKPAVAAGRPDDAPPVVPPAIGEAGVPVLSARLDVLEESLRRAQDPSTWKQQLKLQNVEVAEQVWTSAILDIRKQTPRQLDEVDWIRQALAGRPAADDPRSGFDPWVRYTGLYAESQQVFRACLELIGGLALRDKLLDERICQFADELIGSCAQAMLKYGWLSVPAQQEALSRTLARVIHLRFPEWTIWTLPLAAYEYGHVALDENRELHEFVESEARRLLDVRVGAQLDDDDPMQPRLARVEHHLRVLMNDAFATYMVGPAYACAAILLRFDPMVASGQAHVDPADARRADVVLGMLDRMDAESPEEPYGPVISRLRADWQRTVAEVRATAAPPTKSLKDLSVALDMVLGMLESLDDVDDEDVGPASTLAADVRHRWERIVARAVPAAVELEGPDQDVTIDVEAVLNRLDSVFRFLPGVRYPDRRYPDRRDEGWEVAAEWCTEWLEQLEARDLLALPATLTPESTLRDALNAAWLCRLRVAPDRLPEVSKATYDLCDHIVQNRQQLMRPRRRQAGSRPQQMAQRLSGPKKARYGAQP